MTSLNNTNGKKLNTRVVVHNGVFHADEVCAVSLLRKFFNPSLEVSRLPHQTESFSEFDLIVDLGKKFDGQKFFDHHHNKELEASNMLVFKFLVENGYINEVEEEALLPLMRIISDNDRGVGDKPTPDSIIRVVQSMNEEDIYGEDQNEAFWRASAMLLMFIENIASEANKMASRKAKLENSKEVENGILKIPEFIPFWNNLIFELPQFNDVDIVMWYDEIQGNWKAQVVPDAPGSFGKRGRALKNVEAKGKEFIHVGEFFCVFDTEENLMNYLRSL